MSYQVEEIHAPATAERIAEIAEFLAAFVRGGGLPEPGALDADPDTWSRRLSSWWTSNPFVRDGAPLGFVLRESAEGDEDKNENTGGAIAGFQGFIPQDYAVGAETVPGLISTTLFVSEDARQAAVGILKRLKGLTKTWHLVDGTPSPEVRVLLERFGFHQAEPGTQVYRSAAMARFGAWIKRRRARLSEGERITRDPAEIGSIPPPPADDAKLRKRVAKEGLGWFMRTGDDPRRFVGLLDKNGQLLAYFIATPRAKLGLRLFRIVESAEFSSGALSRLAAFASERPKECGLGGLSSILIWTSLSDGEFVPRWRPRRTWTADLYHLSPEALADIEKVSQPSEGDAMLL